MHDRTRPPAPDGFKFRIIWTAVDTLTGGRTCQFFFFLCQCQAQGQADDISGPHTGRTGLQTAPSHDLSAVRRNRISFQQRLRSKPVERRRNRAEPKPYTAIGCKKTVVNDIDYCTVISMSRRRCITATATFRKTKVAQSSGTENVQCSSGSKYHSFDTTAAPVSGRVDENKFRRCRDKTPLIIRGPGKQPLTVRHINQVLIEGTELLA